MKSIKTVPTIEQSLQRLFETVKSKHPLVDLGTATDNLPILSEENRAAHIHILGTTREGKSKLLELLIRHNVDNCQGATLLDPSKDGSTAKAALAYCVSKNYTNVLLVDLNDKRVTPTINPLKWLGPDAAAGVVSSCMDALQLLWSQVDWQTTSRIQTFMPAILTVLYFAKCTIPDAEAFSVLSPDKGKYSDEDIAELENRRRIILHRVKDIPEARRARVILKDVFANRTKFGQEFAPTIKRLEPFFGSLPRRMFGSTHEPLDFVKIVRNKMLLLVNLDTRGLGGEDLRRLLGTFIINGIVDAISYLGKRTQFKKDGTPKEGGGWVGRHYLYMDEGGLFATRGLADIMAHYGKTGLWATIAHQYYKQFDDDKIIHAIENSSHIKCLFYVAGEYDRSRMLKNMYFGDEMLKSAASAAANLPKQHMIIRIGKAGAAMIRVKDINDPIPPVSPLHSWNFLEKIYKANLFYRLPEAVDEEITTRFANRQDNVTRPDETVRTGRLTIDYPKGGDKDRPNDEAPVKQDAPVEGRREHRSVRAPVQRKKGVSPSVVPEHKQHDEPVGG